MLLASRYTLLEQGALEHSCRSAKRNLGDLGGRTFGILAGLKPGATHDYVPHPRR
jgi:hypothetical protein